MNLPIQHDSFISGTPLNQQVAQLRDQTDHLIRRLTTLTTQPPGRFEGIPVTSIDDHSQSQLGLNHELRGHVATIRSNFTALQAAGHDHPNFQTLRQTAIAGLNAAHEAAQRAEAHIHASASNPVTAYALDSTIHIDDATLMPDALPVAEPINDVSESDHSSLDVNTSGSNPGTSGTITPSDAVSIQSGYSSDLSDHSAVE